MSAALFSVPRSRPRFAALSSAPLTRFPCKPRTYPVNPADPVKPAHRDTAIEKQETIGESKSRPAAERKLIVQTMPIRNPDATNSIRMASCDQNRPARRNLLIPQRNCLSESNGRTRRKTECPSSARMKARIIAGSSEERSAALARRAHGVLLKPGFFERLKGTP